MFFSPWEWHIKNNEIVNWLNYPMGFTSYWRIPILFIVSGMGTRFAFSNKTGKSYIYERISRLFLPLIVGMLIVVPPQVYLERLTQGLDFHNYFDFYPHYFEGVYPSGNFSWHHLWFLPYLLLMSIVATPLFLYLRKEKRFLVEKFKSLINKYSVSLYLLIVPFIPIELLFENKSMTHALFGDWYALVFYFVFFISGYLLISIKSSFWNAVIRIRHLTLIIGVLSFSIIVIFDINRLIFSMVKIVNIWSWILAIFGFAAKYLNRQSSLIKYRNKAVYPFYILHQTITIICGYFLINIDLHYSLKMAIMIVATFGGSWLIYEFIILKIPIIQPLFGVKRIKTIANKA
ncbi:Acyltransferase family protein [Cyclobacterium xiamenense]|uniref:Acyltransferase family protein n=2 Tax=Cyclobacterium xiamenense TaxID=1297121 RepID=A0A1H7B1R6_9BACT|nr:Acyltransferase family protein [Cyclobacterium xiamenense]